MDLINRLKKICDVFSRRSSQYGPPIDLEPLSATLRNRILLLYRDIVSGAWRGNPYDDHTQDFWSEMHNSLQHLYGRPKLSSVHTNTLIDDVISFVMECDSSGFFDFIELSFKLDSTFRIMPNEPDVVDAINEIFRIEDAPYQLTQIVKVEEKVSHDDVGIYPFSRQGVTTIRTVAFPQVVRADEELTHSEAVAPALSVLNAPHFEVANNEFLEAMKEYREGSYTDCLTKCGSSFESVLKVLCERNGWRFNETDTIAPLLDIVIEKSNLEPFYKQPLMLIATIRNRFSSSHGGGSNIRTVTRHVAQYAITITAAAIVLLVTEIDP